MGNRTRGCVERATPAKIAAAERQAKALELRKSGATFESIALALGYKNRSSAADAVTRALRDTVPAELVNEVRFIENLRLDEMFKRTYTKAMQGDLKAVDSCLRIMARRAAMNGLDAPRMVRQAVISEQDINMAIAKIEAQTAALEAPCWANEEQNEPLLN
jgi:hypothetical protein